MPRALSILLLLGLSAVSQAQTTIPVALRDDIRIERFADVAARAVRLARDPVTGRFQYITFDGDLYDQRVAVRFRDGRVRARIEDR